MNINNHMGVELVSYLDINVKDLPSIRYLLEKADTTEFIDGGRARVNEYESKLYIKLNGKYVGFISPRKMDDSEVFAWSKFLGFDLDECWRVTPVYIYPDYQGVGIGRNALKLFFRDKNGLLWIDDENLASQKMAKYAGFKKIKDNMYIKTWGG